MQSVLYCKRNTVVQVINRHRSEVAIVRDQKLQSKTQFITKEAYTATAFAHSIDSRPPHRKASETFYTKQILYAKHSIRSQKSVLMDTAPEDCKGSKPVTQGPPYIAISHRTRMSPSSSQLFWPMNFPMNSKVRLTTQFAATTKLLGAEELQSTHTHAHTHTPVCPHTYL